MGALSRVRTHDGKKLETAAPICTTISKSESSFPSVGSPSYPRNWQKG
jgi:hypothetical protein